MKPDLVNRFRSLALGVNHIGPWAFVGERLDHLVEIADVVFRPLKSEPWAVKGMGRCHRFVRFVGVVSFAQTARWARRWSSPCWRG